MRLTYCLVAGLALVSQAEAFDCAKAKTANEKAICADAKLKAADDAMSAAYDAVMPKLAADQQAALKANQIDWLKSRDDYCAAPEGLTECLMDKTTSRLNFLSGKPASGPGLSGPLLPFIVAKKQTETTCASDVSLHKFTKPNGAGETAWNAAIDKMIKQAGDENGVRDSTPEAPYDCDWSLEGELTYGSPDLIAASVNFFAFGGGAHGIYGKLPLVIDLKSGKTPVFADIFPDTAKAELIKICTAGIRAEKEKRYQDIGDAETTKELLAGLDQNMTDSADALAAGVGDFSNWIVYEDRAEVYFPPYDLGSYAEGDYACAIPKAELKKLGKSGWIVP